VGSGAFFQRSIPTTNQSRCRNYTIQDCYVSGWKNTSFAIRSGAPNLANCWDPMLIFDCTFVDGPSSNPPIRLEHPVQVLHSNNKWSIGGQVRVGDQLFNDTTHTQGIPFAGETTPPPGEGTTPAPPSTSIVMWGDSMTKYLGPTRIASGMGDGRRVINKGIGGQTSVEIAGRQGGIVTRGRVSGEVIPASGGVAITNLYPTITRSNASGVEVIIAGIRGILKPVTGGYEFVRSASGAATPAVGSQVITPVTTDVVNGVSLDLNGYTAILWAGRNGVGSGTETDVTVYQGMVSRMVATEKRALILPVFNGGYSAESNGDSAIPTSGTGAYTSLMNRNAAVAAALPQYWFDVRRLFIDGAAAWMQQKYPAQYASTWTQAYPERTQAGLGPNSAWDVANDVPPRALRSDLVHLNDMGNQFLAELITAELKRRGW
jgi:lysophospholipase L1-like esterase